MLTSCVSREVVEGNAEAQNVKYVDQSCRNRVQKLVVLALLRLVHKLDAKVKLEFVHERLNRNFFVLYFR